MMLQWTGRERIRNGWINDVSLSLSPLTAEHRRKGVRNCYIPDFTESEWVWLESNDGCQVAAALSAPWSSQRSLFIVQTPGTGICCPLSPLTHWLPQLSLLSQLSIPVWKIPSTLHWRPVLCLCFVNFIPKTCYMGPWEFMKLYISDVNTHKQNPQIQTGNINTLGFLCPSADWRKGGGSLIILTPRGGVTFYRSLL